MTTTVNRCKCGHTLVANFSTSDGPRNGHIFFACDDCKHYKWPDSLLVTPYCYCGERTKESYNKQDVRLLPKLYKVLLPWIKSHPNVGLYKDSRLPVCAHCGSTKLSELDRPYTSKTLKYQAYICDTCTTPLRSNKSEGQPQGHLTVRVN